MTTQPTPRRLERKARLRSVPLTMMKVTALAQRERNPAWVDHLTTNMDPEQLGAPVVSYRDGWYFIVDGQHRIEAYKNWSGDDWLNLALQCWVYEGLSEEVEAEMFLKLNDVLKVKAMDKFKVGIQAGRDVETDIDRIVRACGCKVTSDKVEGGVRAVGTLKRVYERNGPRALSRTLRIITSAYGTAGLEAPVIDGVGLLCGRYNGLLEDDKAVKQLSNAHGGVHGLLNAAENLRNSTGNPKGQCVAAAAVTIINRGRGGNKLPDWWRSGTPTS